MWILWNFIFMIVLNLNVIGTQEEDTKQLFLFPDDVRFAQRRCAEQFSQNNTYLIQTWGKYEYPDNTETHCFVKCYLRRLGLINLLTRGLDNDKLYQLWENIDLGTNENCIGDLDLDVELDDLCVSYYKKWIQLRHNCANVVPKLFYELGTKYDYPMKFQLPSKALGMTAVDYCETLDNPEYNTAAEVTQSLNVHSELFQCKLGCIYKRFHYFDAYERLDEMEILRSFEEALKLSDGNIRAIKNCIHQAQTLYSSLERAYCNMAYALQKCLARRFGNKLKIVTRNRNKLSKEY